MLLTLLLLLLVAMGAGVLGALLGLGGGILLVPALTVLFGFPIRVAVGASLVGIIATSAAVASVSRPGRGADVALGLRLEMASALGALVGSLSAGLLSAEALYLIFAAIVLATATFTYRKARRERKPVTEAEVEALFRPDYRPTHWLQGLGFAGLAGGISGLAGTGGGFIKVPVMYSLMEVPLGVATATSNFMVGITACASVVIYYTRGDIRPLVAVPTAVGVFLGAVAGARLAPRLRADRLRGLLIGLLLFIAAQMAWNGISELWPSR